MSTPSDSESLSGTTFRETTQFLFEEAIRAECMRILYSDAVCPRILCVAMKFDKRAALARALDTVKKELESAEDQ